LLAGFVADEIATDRPDVTNSRFENCWLPMATWQWTAANTASHAAQGTTVDRIIVNVDSMHSAQLVNRKQFYVSMSHARVYTDDAEALSRAISRDPKKEIALEAVKPRAALGMSI
jgi:hypothetical protein